MHCVQVTLQPGEMPDSNPTISVSHSIGPYIWPANETSETLSGVTNGKIEYNRTVCVF